MKKLPAYSLYRFKSIDLLGLLQRIDGKLDAILYGSDELTRFREALKALSYALSAEQADMKARSEADARADHAWRCLNDLLTVLQCDPYDAESAEAAAQLLAIVERHGNPTNLPYDQEYAILKWIVEELQAKAELVARARVETWARYLQESYRNFMAISDNLITQTVALNQTSVKDARIELIEAWEDIRYEIEHLNREAIPEVSQLFLEIAQILMDKKAALKA